MEVEGPPWVKDGVSATASVLGKLYAVGGYDGASRQCLSTVEQYNPATNEWTYVADMSTRRSGAGTEGWAGEGQGAGFVWSTLTWAWTPAGAQSTLSYIPFPVCSLDCELCCLFF